MKKKYLILIIFACFLFTGCSAKYNLTIDKTSVKEEIIITESSTSKLKKKYKDLGNVTLKEALKYRSEDIFPAFTYTTYDFEENEKIEGQSYYTATWIENNDNTGFKLNYDFTSTNYVDASSLKKCYEFIRVMPTYGSITISTSQKFTCFDEYDLLDVFTINIKTEHVVTSSNADNVSNNTYTWNINHSNASNKPISITIDTDRRVTDSVDPIEPIDPKEPIKEQPQLEIWHIILVALAIGGLLMIAIVPRILSSRKRK